MEIFESHSIGRQPEIFIKFEFRAEHSKFQPFRRKQNCWEFRMTTMAILVIEFSSSGILVLIFCVEFQELSHLTCDLSQGEKKITVVTS